MASIQVSPHLAQPRLKHTLCSTRYRASLHGRSLPEGPGDCCSFQTTRLDINQVTFCSSADSQARLQVESHQRECRLGAVYLLPVQIHQDVH